MSNMLALGVILQVYNFLRLGTVRKQSVQATIVLAAGIGLGFALKLYIFPKFLEPTEIGLLTVMIDAANLLSALIPLGSQHIFMRYKPYFENENGRTRGLFFIGVMLTLLGLIPFLILFFGFKSSLIQYFQKDSGLLAQYFAFLLPLVIARLLFRLSMDYSKASKKLVFPLFLKEIFVRLLLGALILLYAQSVFDLNALVMGYVSLYFVVGALMFYYLLKFVRVDLSPRPSAKNKGMAREIVTYGLFSVLTAAGAIIVKNIDSIMITAMLNLKNAGVYSIAFFIGIIIELPRKALSQSVAPHLARSFSEQDYTGIKNFYQKTSINQLTLALFIFLAIWINIDPIFSLIPKGEIYSAGKYVVLFIALAYVIDAATATNSAIIQQSPYYRYNLFLMLLMALLFIAGNILLIPLLGINGAALATLISYFLLNLARTLIVFWFYKIIPFTQHTLWLVLWSALLYLVFARLQIPGNPFLVIGVHILILTPLFWLFIYKLNIAPDLSIFIKDLKKRFF